MSDDEKKSLWRKAVKKDGIAGAQETLIKNAMAINPELKGDKNTAEIIAEVQQAKRAEAPAAKAEKLSPMLPPSVRGKPAAQVVRECKGWLEALEERAAAERLQLAEAKKALEAEKRAHDDALRAEIVAFLRESDPQLDSPMTSAVLSAHAPFLQGFGLDSRELKRRMQ